MLSYQGREVDRLYVKLSQLTIKYEDLQQENVQLSAKLHQTDPEPVIQGFQVDAKAPDSITQLQSVQFVKQQLAFLVGRKLQILVDHPDLPYRLLDGRDFMVGNEQYTVRLLTVVVDETPYLRISVSPKNSG